MANTRFAFTNLLDASTTSIINSPSADASFPANNCRNGSRYIPWKSAGSPPSPTDIEFDLGSAMAVTFAAALFVPVVAIAGVDTHIGPVAVESASTPGVWTNRGTITFNAGTLGPGVWDKGVVFGSQTFRYWRFRITTSWPFVIGRLWIGTIQEDMGGLWSPGTIKSTVRNRTRERNPSGVQHSFYHGRALHEWAFHYGKATDAMRAMIDDLMIQQKSVLLIDDASEVFEVEPADRFDWTSVFLNVQDFTIPFEELY